MSQIKQNADGSLGLQGSDADDGQFIHITLPYNATANTAGAFLNVVGPVLSRRMIVKSITGNPETAATNAVTASVFRAPSGTAIGAGTALHSGTFNLQGVAGTNQALTLATTASTLDIPAGTRLGLVISGAPGAAGVGTITVALAPA